MIPAKRLSAAVLAALLFATSIAMCGCDAGGGDKKGKNGKVPGDGKWDSVHKATVGGQYADAPDVEYFSTKYVGIADGLAIFHVEVQKSVPKGQDPMTADYNELQKSFFEFYGKDGSMVDLYSNKSRNSNNLSETIIGINVKFMKNLWIT